MNRLIGQRSDRLHVKFICHCHKASFCAVNRQTYAPIYTIVLELSDLTLK